MTEMLVTWTVVGTYAVLVVTGTLVRIFVVTTEVIASGVLVMVRVVVVAELDTNLLVCMLVIVTVATGEAQADWVANSL